MIEAKTSELPETVLLEKMVGRPLSRLFPEVPVRQLGSEVLRVKALSGKNKDGKKLFGPVSFSLRQGEILGFAGLLGAGRTEILQTLFGDRDIVSSGEIFLEKQKVKIADPAAAFRKKLALIPEDRKRDSLLPNRSLTENVGISRLANSGLVRGIRQHTEEEYTRASLKRFGTKYAHPEQWITELSGGNQQKVIFGRAMQTNPDIILLDEPTRGIDVGAKYEIYEILFQLAREGKSFLLVSSDLLELMALSDRLLVLAQGNLAGSFTRDQYSQTDIMRLALGPRSKE